MVTFEKLKNRLASLTNKHRELDNNIEKMYNEGYSDNEIHSLKKQKLQLKDEITSLQQQLESDNG